MLSLRLPAAFTTAKAARPRYAEGWLVSYYQPVDLNYTHTTMLISFFLLSLHNMLNTLDCYPYIFKRVNTCLCVPYTNT